MTIQKIAFFYLVIPLFIFCATWFNFYACTILLLSLFISCYFTNVSTELGEQPYILNKKTILLAVVIASIWCFWSGIGGYVYQSNDFIARNAIYRDLIEYTWPVYYKQDEDYALNYYIGFWVLPALITKFIGLFINNQDLLFTIGLNILLLHSIIGVTIFFLLLVSYIKPKNNKQILLVLLFPLFFSGMDIIGAKINHSPFFYLGNYNFYLPNYPNLHIETYNGLGEIQYSSLTTQLFWVFNQCIPSWIITLLVLKNKKLESYGVLITLALFYCPLPMVGIAIIMLTNCILFMLSNKFTIKDKIKKIISLSNLYIMPIFITIYVFTSLNGAGQHNSLGFKSVAIDKYLLFCFIEFGCFLFFIFPKYHRTPMFYVMIFSLLILCLFSFEKGYGDFQMRTTIPLLLLLMIYVLQYLQSSSHFGCNAMLYILLAIGMCTPLVEFSRGYMQIASSKKIKNLCDEWYSLQGKPYEWPYYNYILQNPYSYKYYNLLVKRPQENERNNER